MFDFDGFERREMALQNNAQEHADNIHAQIVAKAEGNKEWLAELKIDARRIWNEKQAIYDGDVKVQQEIANREIISPIVSPERLEKALKK